MATASSTINVNGKTVTVESNLDDGSYTVKDSGGRLIGNGSNSSGGTINFSSGSSDAQKQLLGLSGSRSRFLQRDLKNKIQKQVQRENINLLNKNASNTQKLNLRDMGYGDKLNTPLYGTLHSSTTGGNNGSDAGETVVENKGYVDPFTKGQDDFGGSARYPQGYIDGDYDYVRFEIIKYVPQEQLTDIIKGGGTGRPSERIKNESKQGDFILPIPTNISARNDTSWGEDRLNPLQAGGAGIVDELLGGKKGAGQEAIDAVGRNNPELMEFIKKKAASRIVGGSNILTRTTGAVINSNLELFFTGPGLRGFNFTYRLTPRDKKEAGEIKKIIRMSKRAMSARLQEDRLFMYTPHIFKIKYFKGSQAHPYLNLFKPCALKSFDANFTPDNAYMTYDDGSPIAYNLQFAFQEIEPIYDIDYADDGRTMGF